MPLDRDDLNPEQAERLHRKIERLIAGQPAPVLDGDTEELAEIARVLNARLPEDIPDPGFREQLKKDLLDPGPRLVPFRPRSEPRRYPVVAVVGALALVIVATTVASVLTLDIGVGDGSARQAILSAATPTTPLSASALYASSSMTAEQHEATPNTVMDGEPSSVDRSQASPPVDDVDDIEPSPTATSIDAEPTPAPDSPARTQVLTVIDLPPIDDNHVELGALATVAAPDDAGQPDIAYSLESDLPQFDSSALAYRFSAPHIDAQLILRSVGDFLGIEPDTEMQQERGRTFYSFSSPDNGASFTWKPDSGAFVCTLPDAHSTADVADLSASAITWLKEFGYPVDETRAQPVIETRDTGERLIHVPLGYSDELPDPVLGHPLRITLVVDPTGRIVRVSGYWLEVTSSEVVPLLTAEQAWRRLSAGDGYWPGGTAPTSPGEFSVSSFSIRYMLTVDSQSNDLVLQPVIAASGTFTPTGDGTPYATTVYLQAAAQI